MSSLVCLSFSTISSGASATLFSLCFFLSVFVFDPSLPPVLPCFFSLFLVLLVLSHPSPTYPLRGYPNLPHLAHLLLTYLFLFSSHFGSLARSWLVLVFVSEAAQRQIEIQRVIHQVFQREKVPLDPTNQRLRKKTNGTARASGLTVTLCSSRSRHSSASSLDRHFLSLLSRVPQAPTDPYKQLDLVCLCASPSARGINHLW